MAQPPTWEIVVTVVIPRERQRIVSVPAGELRTSNIAQVTIGIAVTYQHHRVVPSQTLAIVSTVVI